MSSHRQQILAQAMTLDPTERAVLAEELWLSLEQADREAIDAAWLAEARRRDALYAKGETSALPVDQAIERTVSRRRP